MLKKIVINLALTGRLRGNQIAVELSPFLLNLDATRDYILAMCARQKAIPPVILIELSFEDTDNLAALKGTNNSLREAAPGVKVRIAFNNDFIDEYAEDVKAPELITWVPPSFTRSSGRTSLGQRSPRAVFRQPPR